MVFTIAVQVAIIVAVVAAIILISQGIVISTGLSLPDILTEMPTFYEYTDNGTRAYAPVACDRNGDSFDSSLCVWQTAECAESTAMTNPICQEKPSPYLKYYWLLAGIGGIILILAICYNVVRFLFEEPGGWVRQGEAFENIKRIIPQVIIIALLPTVWDPVALTIEDTALYLMAPFSPEEDSFIDVWVVAAFANAPEGSFKNHAQLRGAWLMMEAGNIIPPSVWQPEAITGMILNPDAIAGNVFTSAFLGMFKAVIAITVGLEVWITGIVRVLATMITIMAIPILYPLSLIPQFKSATEDITKFLPALLIAPIFSAIVFTIGLAYLSSSRGDDELIRWIQALCVVFMCSSAVTAIAGGFVFRTVNSISSHVQTAISSATVAATSMVSGGISGAMGMKNTLGGASGTVGTIAQGSIPNGEQTVSAVQTAMNSGRGDGQRTMRGGKSAGQFDHQNSLDGDADDQLQHPILSSSSEGDLYGDGVSEGATTPFTSSNTNDTESSHDGGIIVGNVDSGNNAGRRDPNSSKRNRKKTKSPSTTKNNRTANKSSSKAKQRTSKSMDNGTNKNDKSTTKSPKTKKQYMPKFKDYATGFFLGALGGGMSHAISGSLPSQYGMNVPSMEIEKMMQSKLQNVVKTTRRKASKKHINDIKELETIKTGVNESEDKKRKDKSLGNRGKKRYDSMPPGVG